MFMLSDLLQMFHEGGPEICVLNLPEFTYDLGSKLPVVM